MPKVNCDARNCAYNMSNVCKKYKVSVDGHRAYNDQGTQCDSFIEGDTDFSSEFANFEEFDTDVKIKCSANHCRHNTKGACVAKEIAIRGRTASNSSSTKCDSFE